MSTVTRYTYLMFVDESRAGCGGEAPCTVYFAKWSLENAISPRGL